MASDCDIASSADLAILYAPYLAWECRTTIEFTLTTEPLASASAGVKPWVNRSAPNTVSSIASRMCSKVVLANGFIDGTRNALLISTSTLPYALSDSSTRLLTCSSSVMSVPTDDRAPAHVGDLLGDVVETLDGAGRQHQVCPCLGTSPCERGAQGRARRH